MKYNTIIQGNIKDVTLPEVDMVLTSPPYWGLRDYGVDGQLGLEPTPKLYIEHLCDIFDSLPIKKTGSLWVNIGDSYGGNCSRASQGGRAGYGTEREGVYSRGVNKSLVGIPQRFMIEMIDRGWVCRNVIIWYKPSCMPSSVKDRFTVDFEYLYFFTKQGEYYFEQQLEPHKTEVGKPRDKNSEKYKRLPGQFSKGERTFYGEEGRNKRCVWKIPASPSNWEYCNNCDTIFIGKDRNRIRKYKIEEVEIKECPVCNSTEDWESHFAMYPEELCVTPIKAGCPEGDVVLDPFLGSGTTALVAHKLGRDWLGVELSPISKRIAEARIEKEMKQGILF